MASKFSPELLPNETGRLHTRTEGSVIQSTGDLENMDIGAAVCNIAALAGGLRLKNQPNKRCCKISLVFNDYSYSLSNHGTKFVYSKVSSSIDG